MKRLGLNLFALKFIKFPSGKDMKSRGDFLKKIERFSQLSSREMTFLAL